MYGDGVQWEISSVRCPQKRERNQKKGDKLSSHFVYFSYFHFTFHFSCSFHATQRAHKLTKATTKVSDQWGRWRSIQGISPIHPCSNKLWYLFFQFLCIDRTIWAIQRAKRREKRDIVLKDKLSLWSPFIVSGYCTHWVLSPWAVHIPLSARASGHFKDFLFTTFFSTFPSISKERTREGERGLNLTEADFTSTFFVHPHCIPHLFLKWDLECQGGCK